MDYDSSRRLAALGLVLVFSLVSMGALVYLVLPNDDVRADVQEGGRSTLEHVDPEWLEDLTAKSCEGVKAQVYSEKEWSKLTRPKREEMVRAYVDAWSSYDALPISQAVREAVEKGCRRGVGL